MNLSFTYSKSEFTRAMRQSYDDRKRIVFDLLLSVAVIFYGIYEISSARYEIFSAFIIVLAALYLFVIFAKYFIAPSVIYKKNPQFKEEIELAFLPDEIHFKAGAAKSTLPWSAYRGLKETKEFIFLQAGKNQATYIPKRIFKNSDDMNAFMTMVRFKVK